MTEATRMDQVPAKCLKVAADVLAYPTIQNYKFVDEIICIYKECKIAKLKPLLKKGSKIIPKNC